MTDDFAFDKRIAGQYRDHRAHPNTVSTRIGQEITQLIPPDARILEVGVGTGRIAAPVAQAGGRVMGFDISAEMLDQIAYEAGSAYPVVQADMLNIPFRRGTFGAVMVTHVLHLTRELERVLSEVVRVLQPDGVVIQGEDWTDPDSVIVQLRSELRRIVLDAAPHYRPPGLAKSREQILADLGATQTDETIVAEWTVYTSPAARLREIASRSDPESWVLPPDLFDAVVAGLTDYVAANYADPEADQPVKRRFLLKTTHGNWMS